jgi:hypothetical protein
MRRFSRLRTFAATWSRPSGNRLGPDIRNGHGMLRARIHQHEMALFAS